ncbi:MAG: nucleoside deaminase [Myxococcaceae bacterium]
MSSPTTFLHEAIELARENVRRGGRPFGAIVVKDGQVIARGVNEIYATNDPTAHAELLALRAAGRALGTPRLDGCAVYASGHPCPMCLAAMRMAGIAEVAYAYSQEDAEPYGLSTAAIYAELARPFPLQSMKLAHIGVDPAGEEDLYESWRRTAQR